MKRLTALYILISALCSININGQYTIVADKTAGCDSLEVAFSVTPNTGITSASWNFGDGQTSSLISPTIKYTTPGSFNVSVMVNGTDADTSIINVYSTPTAQFSHKDTLGYFNIFFECQQENQANAYTYSWDFDDGDTYVHDSIICVHRYSNAGDYLVTLNVSNTAGCSATDTSTVSIIDVDELEIQKAFSPNNDGENDYFNIETDGISVYSMTIFTRSGALVYKTESPFLSWDGSTTNGVEASQGIYFYFIEKITGNNSYKKVGYFYLFR